MAGQEAQATESGSLTDLVNRGEFDRAEKRIHILETLAKTRLGEQRDALQREVKRWKGALILVRRGRYVQTQASELERVTSRQTDVGILAANVAALKDNFIEVAKRVSCAELPEGIKTSFDDYFPPERRREMFAQVYTNYVFQMEKNIETFAGRGDLEKVLILIDSQKFQHALSHCHLNPKSTSTRIKTIVVRASVGYMSALQQDIDREGIPHRAAAIRYRARWKVVKEKEHIIVADNEARQSYDNLKEQLDPMEQILTWYGEAESCDRVINGSRVTAVMYDETSQWRAEAAEAARKLHECYTAITTMQVPMTLNGLRLRVEDDLGMMDRRSQKRAAKLQLES